MAQASSPPLVKLICGMIAARAELFEQAEGRLAEAFGPIDVASETMDFDFTHYYDAEMGGPLMRRFVAFERLVSPEQLIDAKLATNAIEADFAAAQAAGPARVARPVNLDPGYIEPSKLVLASMKNFSHRLYLGRGVFGELTLVYHKGSWDALPWTFPDFASGRYYPFLTAARTKLRQQQVGRSQESES